MGPLQSNQQISGVPKKEEAEKHEFEKFPNPNSFVVLKINFTSAFAPHFPSEAATWINDIDSARNIDELKSSNSILRRMLPDFEELDSEIASALKKLLTADFKQRRVYMEEEKVQQDNRFLKKKINCLLQDPWNRRSSS